MKSVENQPFITVIVPCYNVEKYVDKCISSIVGQTYLNLDILLIDDGSQDNTGKICDSWQEKDDRIRVIHKQNEGLAYARKTGVENATADFITFVDSDDWIDPNMYAQLMSALLSTNSDIAQCDLCFIYEDGRIEQRIEKFTNSVNVLGRIEGVLLILNDQMWRMSYCTKLYKKSLFDNIIFPKGRTWGEDYVNHELFQKASQTILLDSAYYFYYQRSDSITKFNNIQKEIKKIYDANEAYFERYNFVKQYPEYHSALPYVKHMALHSGLILLRNLIIFPQYFSKKEFYSKAKQMRSIKITKKDYLQRSLLIDLSILKVNINLYKLLRKLYLFIILITNKLKITNHQINKLHTLW